MSETADEDAIVRAFAAGATDYVVLPQHGDLLAARLRAALRLTGAAISGEEPESLTVGEISLYPREGWAEHRGERLNLTPTEFSLLLALGRAGGQPVPHRTLIATVWGPEYVDCRNYLRLYIRYLRGKIEDDPDAPAVVMNEWGVGYFLSNGVREPGTAK
jgi:two-component system KDP operon response regulator KdpE